MSLDRAAFWSSSRKCLRSTASTLCLSLSNGLSSIISGIKSVLENGWIGPTLKTYLLFEKM